ncbi:ATP-binding protein [Saccharicrinis sp. FJH54]|uniref:ATP-binding protein n=1 Tax=Saccharicrinis sp. FJH54 TaxID=3344665 RepID=UPI0035D5057B
MYYSRKLKEIIKSNLYKGKIIVLFGARRTGKTTLVKELVTESEVKAAYINCDLFQYRSVLSSMDHILLKDLLGNNKLVVLDEAQQIENIGLTLKIIADTFPEIQIIATGSSSFDLSNKISEPLTGRSRKYMLMPISIEELHGEHNLVDIRAMLSSFLKFGFYPQVLNASGDEKIEEINEISSNYLYKDLLQFESIKKPELIFNLLKAVALQLGCESSLNELSQLTGTSVHTVKRYLDLLEKSFVIFRLTSFSRNLRKEINKSQKIYFYDTGVRNAVVQNFNNPELRNDIGGLWENFCITERMKYNHYNRRFVNSYFWRTYDQKEIDYIEEQNGVLTCFEFKYSSKKVKKVPKEFIETYPDSTFKTITPDNFYELIEV